ncbi:MAG TPA: hypothetical protein DG414_10295 [Gammaproteobacteria bacterium]|jgi:ABC-type uncharacterized transport system permease subunit|nr:cytochrome c biogenesis protein CcsA [Arenicellales bacterium]HCY14217.1 hypothetical protein [Gammaproteobacteria bacterium]|tara:strand:- start:680 stop:1492 length:813 start_codon:yes stop_codon:yes gene_type:complete
MIHLLNLLAVLAYLGATGATLRQAQQRETENRQADTVAIAAGVVAAICHGANLAPATIAPGGPALALGTTVSLIGLLIVVLYLAARLLRPLGTLGMLVFPAAALALVTGWIFPGEAYAPRLQGSTALTHILGAGLAYALLSLALAQALLLTAQDHTLRQKKTTRFFATLPPVETMEAVLFQLIYAGFALLTVTLISGGLSSGQMFGNALLLNHHTVLALLAWLSILVLIIGRLTFGWRGRAAVIWTSVGFSLLALGYFGTRFVLEVLLGN